MKKTFVLSMLVISFSTLFAQTFQWVHSVAVDYAYNPSGLMTACKTDADDNIIFTGLQTAISPDGSGDVFWQKMSPDGHLLDEVIMQGEGRPPTKLATDEDNNLYFFIQYKTDLTWADDTIKASTSGINMALVKLDEDFNLLWVQYQQVQSDKYTHKPLAVRNGQLYTGAVINWDTTAVRVMDLEGNLQREILQANIDILSSLAVDDDGNIYVAGSCAGENASFNGVAFPPPDVYNTYLVKYDTSGVPAWVKYIQDVTCISPEVFVSDPEHVYFSAVLNMEADLDTIHLAGPSWVYDFFVTRLNSEGVFLWAREVPEITGGDASIGNTFLGADFTFITEDANHNVHLTGFIRGTVDWGNGIVTESNDLSYNILSWSYNPDGEMRYAVAVGGNQWDAGQNIVVDGNGEIYLSGIGSDTVTFGDIVVEETGRFSFISRLSYGTTGIGQTVSADELLTYPNPASAYFYIDVKEDLVIRIFDLTGREVLLQSFTDRQRKKVNVSALKPGIYLIRASGHGFLYNGRLVKK